MTSQITAILSQKRDGFHPQETQTKKDAQTPQNKKPHPKNKPNLTIFTIIGH